MAIDTNQPVRESSIRTADGSIIDVRVGIEGGRVVVEENGVIRPATQAESDNYRIATAADTRRQQLKSLLQAVQGPTGEYLRAKFPEDFE